MQQRIEILRFLFQVLLEPSLFPVDAATVSLCGNPKEKFGRNSTLCVSPPLAINPIFTTVVVCIAVLQISYRQNC